VTATEGAGVRIRRAFGAREAALLDPFLLLDEFGSDDPAEYRVGFPWHPHRGIETITYMLAGRVAHRDSLGSSGVVGPGDVQWMTAGSGIIHEEMPAPGDTPLVRGFQLWANLPADRKMTAPRYREVRAADIPAVTTPAGARVRVVAGEFDGARGPVRDVATEPAYLDVELPPGSVFSAPAPRGRTVFCYVFEGAVRLAEGPVPAGSLVLLGDGDEVHIDATGTGCRFLLVGGRPLGEPIAWWGPIVMSSEEELRAAIADYHNGTFVRQRG
jgi:hypothetical protein